jgi:hypothetical protein
MLRETAAGVPLASFRPWVLLAATLLWLWASSVFTPWAADRLHRLWLYDTLFYARFALMFWAAAEVALLLFRPRGHRANLALAPLAGTALAVLGSLFYLYSEAGMRWRVVASLQDLSATADAGYSDERRRAGHFLVDSVREPCPGQAWLWLGRPYGGGTGTSIALVRAGTAPLAPTADAFAFWPVTQRWWLAYQHAGHYRRLQGDANAPACRPGRILSGQGEGQAWVDEGRRALQEK